MSRISKVAARAQTELDVARAETRQLNTVISGLQQRLDALEARGSVRSDHPPLESGSSDDGWGPGPGPGRPHAPGGAPSDAFPWGAGHGTLRWTHASEQAGKALRSQGHQCVVM